MTAAIKDPISSAQENFLLATTNTATTLQLKAKEVENKEKETAQKKSRLMPTGGTAKLDPTSNAAMAQIKKTIDQMTPEQRKAFVDALLKFESDVAKVKAEIANVKDSATVSGVKALVNSMLAVRDDVKTVIQAAKSGGADAGSGTSIWFVLEQFMVNDVMGMNNLEMSAAMKQVQAQTSAIANVANGLSHLNTQITDQKSTDTGKSVAFSIGVFLLGLFLAIPTGGLSLVAGTAIAIAFPVCNSIDTSSGSSSPRFDFLSDSAPNTSQMLEDQNTQQSWSLVGTNSNQQLSTVMQLHVQQTSQVNLQAAQQFSTMINYASQTMSTGR